MKPIRDFFINNRLPSLFTLRSLLNIELLILFLEMFLLFEKNIEFYEKGGLLWLKEINIYQN